MVMQESQSKKNKRIFKNTLFLYFRLLLVMLVAFYTSRVVLDKLGFIDYGIQNVVGGLASMFVFFRSSLSNVTQRYLNIALAEGNFENTKIVFCQHQTIYMLISLIVVVLAETIGLWFVYHKLVIPTERLSAAFWVFQITVVSLVVTLLSVVYDSVIIAHENMKIYAYVGIFEGFAKLGVAYLIGIAPIDRLVFYSFLLFIIALGIRVFYAFYCKKYSECQFHFLWDKRNLKDVFSMVSWNTVGTAVWAVNNQGMDILLNMFFGPAINAAKGVASHLSQAVNNFATNFFVSVRPQITKSYAAQDFDYLMKLFYGTSKYSFFLLWFLALPLMLNVDYVLNVWLKNVPDYAGVFVNLILAYSLVNVLDAPIWSIALAVGKLKKYICIGSGVFLMSFPISYIFLKFGYPPTSVLVVNVVVRFVYIWVVLLIIKQFVPLSIVEYLKKVVSPIAVLVCLSGIIMLKIGMMFESSLFDFVFCCCLCVVVNFVCIFFVGLNKVERQMFAGVVKKKIVKK